MPLHGRNFSVCSFLFAAVQWHGLTQVLGTMDRDTIASVEIDDTGRLLVVPSYKTFPLIYREAAEVHWDVARQALYSPKPREWTYPMWFRHILEVAASCHVLLCVTPETQWRNIDSELQAKLLEVARSGA
jgi:hypothetical protein